MCAKVRLSERIHKFMSSEAQQKFIFDWVSRDEIRKSQIYLMKSELLE